MTSGICQDKLPEPGLKQAPHNTKLSPSIERHSRSCATDSAVKEILHGQYISNNTDDAKKHDNCNKGGWSFLQALTNTSQSTKDGRVYVPPDMKRSSSMLNLKSLEMCTESLGSETGIIFDSNSLLPHPIEDCHSKESSRLKGTYSVSKKLNHGNSFPPLLTSMSGSGGVRFRPHREGGRLTLEAVTIPPHKSCFHAERIMGRLRLHLLNASVLDSEANEQEEEMHFANEDGEMKDNGDNAESEMEVEKLPRLSRSGCVEGGQSSKRMLKCEPSWVAA